MRAAIAAIVWGLSAYGGLGFLAWYMNKAGGRMTASDHKETT